MFRTRKTRGRLLVGLAVAGICSTAATPLLAQMICSPKTICVTTTKYLLGFIVVSKTVECFEGEVCQ